MVRKNSLGRGLDALLSTEEIRTEGSSSINEVDLSLIVPNPDQPRRAFDEEALTELATSIRTIGLIQPISLRMMADGHYQIIAGERRFRAAKLAGLQTLPAYIKTAEDDLVMEMALIENIQREDLNAIEIALAFQKLLEIYQLTQEKLSERLGKKRATIANYLRLLKLPAEIQLGLKDHKIDMGHAKTLISLEDPAKQIELYEALLANGYSVRKMEELVKAAMEPLSNEPVAAKKPQPKTPEEFMLLQQLLSDQLNTNVKFLIGKKGKGSITIPFNSEAQLEDLLARFDKLMR
ncbi:MAG: putative chromosome-partitioning protein ParB [Bacteroidetes bacterium ADurb.Bin416]|jgi:ParB family chromosome partitioning protein|nr:MAG: putative chromosome-partitioning protein ParB [Bacteroidetes bacterium ADurb.Bin416]